VFSFERRGDVSPAWKNYGWNHAHRLLGEMHALLQERRVSLVVLVFPISEQVNHEYLKVDEAYVLYPQRKIREICEDRGIPMLDLTDSVYREGGPTLFRDHLHLDGKGNDVVANELEKYIVNLLELRS
jgi:lysophospholipase L1-like esterase